MTCGYRAGDEAGLHNGGSATTDDSGGGHRAARQSSIGGQASILGLDRH